MKRTNRIVNWLLAVIWLLQLAVEGMTVISVQRLEMLPNKYFALLCGILLGIWLLTGLFLLLGRRGTKGGNFLRCIAAILVIVTVAGCALAFTAVSRLRDTLHNITNHTNASGVTMMVYVRADDPAQSLSDAADYTFASVQGYEEDRTNQTIAAIEKELGRKITVKQFTGVHEMVEALYQGETDAIILNGAYVELLEESEGYEDFAEKTRVLYQVVTAEAPKPTEPNPSGDATKPSGGSEQTEPVEVKDVTQKPFILYFSGSDTRYETLRTSRSDVNILVVVNPVTKQVLLVNTPRDYYVPNPAGNGARDKLTHCGIYGIQCSIGALEGLYGISVDYYAQINFTGFKTLIDAIGGITVYADYPFVASGGTYIVAGENQLDGKEALAFARERHNAGGDNGRGRNQMKVITAVIGKVTSSTTMITNYSAILDSLSGMFVTSMDMSDIGKLVKMQLEDMASWNVLSYAVTGKNGRDVTYSMPGSYLSVMYVNQELVDRGTELIERVLAGEILTEADVK